MSNALAIATATAALAQVVRVAAQSAVNGAEVLTSGPDPNAEPAHRVHLFLYRVSPNGAMDNNDLPALSSDGTVVKCRPAVALDLHYLLAFYGSASELEAQRMFGAVVRDLNAKPVLTRQAIRDAVASQPTFLAGSDLADAAELVKFSPLSLSLEDMSKLWSVLFQVPYALSVAYQGTVVVLEHDEPAHPALPVLKRGGKDRGADILLGPFPVLESAHFGMPGDGILQARPLSLPAAQLGRPVIVVGRNLGAENVTLRFDHSKLGVSQPCSVAAMNVSSQELMIQLPDPGSGTSQEDWAPGIYTITVVHRRPGAVHERTSNALPVSLSPIIGLIEPDTTIQRDAQGVAKITITCHPRIRKQQQVVLLLAGLEIVGQIDDADKNKVVFTIDNAPVVTDELIRLRVDGIESMPYQRVDTPPPSRFEFDSNQQVTIT